MHLSTPLFLLVSLFSLPAINGLTLCLYEREIGASTANGTIAAAAECFAGKGEGMQLCWKDAANGGVVLGEKCREVIESGGAEANGFSVVDGSVLYTNSTSTSASYSCAPTSAAASDTTGQIFYCDATASSSGGDEKRSINSRIVGRSALEEALKEMAG